MPMNLASWPIVHSVLRNLPESQTYQSNNFIETEYLFGNCIENLKFLDLLTAIPNIVIYNNHFIQLLFYVFWENYFQYSIKFLC